MGENIKNSCVKEESNKIMISDPSPSLNKKEDKKKKEEVSKKEKDTPVAVAKPTAPVNPILRKRFNRGSNVFDCFVGVRGFAQHIKNMGKASDMDVCNYFIHNHKDVADVKFFNWTEIVFAKFNKSMMEGHGQANGTTNGAGVGNRQKEVELVGF